MNVITEPLGSLPREQIISLSNKNERGKKSKVKVHVMDGRKRKP